MFLIVDCTFRIEVCGDLSGRSWSWDDQRLFAHRGNTVGEWRKLTEVVEDSLKGLRFWDPLFHIAIVAGTPYEWNIGFWMHRK